MLKESLPSLFTSLNLLLGLIAIFTAWHGNIILSAWFIIWAALCDGMDGKLARLTHSESSLGFELDSLADMSSFGIAPGFLAYRVFFTQYNWIGFVFVFIFCYAGMYRLARFNVIQKGDRTQGYIGLPITVAGMTMASFVLFEFKENISWIWPVLIIVLSLVMVSRIQYQWPRLMFHEGKLKFSFSLLYFLGLLLMMFFPYFSLFPILIGYMIYGILHEIICCMQEERSLMTLFITQKSG